MKYKVIFSRATTSSNEGMANAEFYVLQEAIAACDGWRQISSGHTAFLFNGSDWVIYAPIP